MPHASLSSIDGDKVIESSSLCAHALVYLTRRVYLISVLWSHFLFWQLDVYRTFLDVIADS